MATARIGAVLIVLDGLRADMVTPDVMPCLTALSRRGTTFSRARGVFPSVSAVAAASLATGALPARHGILCDSARPPLATNTPGADPAAPTPACATRRSGSGLQPETETFADLLAAAGRRLAIVDTGSPAAAAMIDPRLAQHRTWAFSTRGRAIFAASAAWTETVKRFGFPPEQELPRFDELSYGTDVFIETVLGEQRPDVAVLWLSEPDATAQGREIGALETENVVRHADRQIGRVLAALEQQQGLDRTLLIVASDHGQITSRGEVRLAEALRAAGLPAGCCRESGVRLVLTNGGFAALSLLAGGEAGLVERAARWLMEQPWTGHVFTADRNGVEGTVPGTLSLALAGLDHPRAPNIVLTFSSDLGLDRHGVAGRGLHASRVCGPGAIHGGLNLHEMSTLLLASGPGLAAGAVSHAVAGILDIAPTILDRLGLPALPASAGRSLAALPAAPPRVVTFEAGHGGFVQSVVTTQTEHGRRLEMDAAPGSAAGRRSAVS